uniref:Bromo domain-containing protein n=1 Tax=Rhabditophanes sp. KR3021 TaxID=114890 RepID=A0AC35UG40_9BILA
NRVNITGTRSRPTIAPPNLNGNNVVPNARRTRLRARLNRNLEEPPPEEALPPVRRSRRGAARIVIFSEDEDADERGRGTNRLPMMEELAELSSRAATPVSENGDDSLNEELSVRDEQRDESRSEESVTEEEAPASIDSHEDVTEMSNDVVSTSNDVVSMSSDAMEMPCDCDADLNENYPAFCQVYKLRRFPYYPQIGDHIVYFKQGYEAYQAEVKKQKLYTISKSKKRNMLIDPKLNAETFCVVTKIEYLSNPQALIHVTVTVTDEVKLCNGESFQIYYNNCNDVADFLILREYYDIALRQKFKPSNKVETIMLDESKFYTGTVQSIRAFDEAWPESLWNRVIVRWNYDPTTTYAASAWEIDGMSEGRVDGELATDEEYARLARIGTNSQDWGEKEMDVVLDRAKAAIMLMMRSEEVEIFNDPVDFNLYPDYLDIVPYPIDLSLIVKRIEHKFYRRLVALEQDIKQIAINSELYNGNIDVTKTAQALVEALLTYINSDETDVEAVFEECMAKNADDLKKYSETPDEESLLNLINAALWEENPAPTEDSIWWRTIIRKCFKDYRHKWIVRVNRDSDIVDSDGYSLCSTFGRIYTMVFEENFTDYEVAREQLRSLIEAYEQNDERSRDSEKYVSDMKNILLSPMEELISRIENCNRNQNEQEASHSAFDVVPRRPGLRQQIRQATMDSTNSSRSRKSLRRRNVVNYAETNLSRVGSSQINVPSGRSLRKRPLVTRIQEDDGTTSEEEICTPVKSTRHARFRGRRLNSEGDTEEDGENHTSNSTTSTNTRLQRSNRINPRRCFHNKATILIKHLLPTDYKYTEAIKTTKDEDYEATDGDSDVSDERNPDYFREDTNFIKNINLEDHWGDKNRPEDKKNKVISHISSSFTDGRSFACTKVKPTLITGTSLENLSPEDIGIIASMGDSIATGSARLWPESSINFRGSSFTTGGDATIDGLVTIPNILKEFGSGNLFGVSHGMGTKDQLPKHQLNVAVSGSNSSFLPNQAKDLVDRIKKVKEIDTYNTWTLVLITVGTEEICNHCQVPNVDALKESMDILNRGIHKALIVLIGPVHVASPYQLKANLLKKRCNCSKHESDDFMIKMSEEWVK